MTTYAMSAKIEQGCPVALVSEAGLYDRFYEKAEKSKIKIGYFPWYSNAQTCPIPEGCCLITKSKKLYEFGIRIISSTLYIVSEDFLRVMKTQKLSHGDAKEIQVRSVSGSNAAASKYYITRIPYLKFTDLVNKNKSKFTENEGRFELEKIEFHDRPNDALFCIEDLIGEHRTLFCSKSFRDEVLGMEIKGINFFEDKLSKWQTLFDFLDNAGKAEPKNMIWPI